MYARIQSNHATAGGLANSDTGDGGFGGGRERVMKLLEYRMEHGSKPSTTKASPSSVLRAAVSDGDIAALGDALSCMPQLHNPQQT